MHLAIGTNHSHNNLARDGLQDFSGGGELENDILASKLAVDGREGVKLVLQRGGILGVKEATMYMLV
jgi:hypothetical protein